MIIAITAYATSGITPILEYRESISVAQAIQDYCNDYTPAKNTSDYVGYSLAGAIPAQPAGGWYYDHDTPGLVQSLSAKKESRFIEIDIKTGQLIAAGFSFDSQTFSLSANAQANWNTLKSQESEFTWPVEISTADNNTYSLAQVDLSTFWQTGRDTVKGHLDSGRSLKKQVYDAANEAAVDAVVDTR